MSSHLTWQWYAVFRTGIHRKYDFDITTHNFFLVLFVLTRGMKQAIVELDRDNAQAHNMQQQSTTGFCCTFVCAPHHTNSRNPESFYNKSQWLYIFHHFLIAILNGIRMKQHDYSMLSPGYKQSQNQKLITIHIYQLYHAHSLACTSQKNHFEN